MKRTPQIKITFCNGVKKFKDKLDKTYEKNKEILEAGEINKLALANFLDDYTDETGEVNWKKLIKDLKIRVETYDDSLTRFFMIILHNIECRIELKKIERRKNE